FTGGRGVATSTLTSPRVSYYSQIEPGITKRLYDVTAAQRLLDEGGYRRGSDGTYVSPTGERLSPEVWTTGGAQYEREIGIFVDSLRRVGVDASPQALGAARLQD